MKWVFLGGGDVLFGGWRCAFLGGGNVSYWFWLVFTAFKGFKILNRHLLRVLSCKTPFQALTPKSQKEQNNDNIDWDTFTFIQFVSSRSTRSAKNWSRQAQPLPSSQVNENRLLVWKQKSQKVNPKPQHSSNPLQAPPARLLTSSPPPCWLAGWQRVGGPPSSYPLITSPPPVLHSVHSYPSHLIPTIHQNCPLKVFNIHSFCHLSVQADGRAHARLQEPEHGRAGEAIWVRVKAHHPVLLGDPRLDAAGLDHGDKLSLAFLRRGEPHPGGQVRQGQGDEGAG